MNASQILKLASNISSLLATQLAPENTASPTPAAPSRPQCAVCEQSDGMLAMVAGEALCGACLAQVRRDNQDLRKQISELTRASEELARASEELARSAKESESVPRVPNACMIEVVRDKRIACLCIPKTDMGGVLAFVVTRYPGATLYVDGSLYVSSGSSLLKPTDATRRSARSRKRKE